MVNTKVTAKSQEKHQKHGGQRNITLLFCKRVCGKETIIHMTTYQSFNESLFYIEQIGFCFKSVLAGIRKLWPSFQSYARRKENGGLQYVIINSPIKISVSSTKLKQNWKDSVCYSESINVLLGQTNIYHRNCKSSLCA